MSKRIALILFATVAWVGVSSAQNLDDGGCVYNRKVYPEGAELCQGGSRVRCEAGDWADIGLCHGDEPAPPPRERGGDVEE